MPTRPPLAPPPPVERQSQRLPAAGSQNQPSKRPDYNSISRRPASASPPTATPATSSIAPTRTRPTASVAATATPTATVDSSTDTDFAPIEADQRLLSSSSRFATPALPAVDASSAIRTEAPTTTHITTTVHLHTTTTTILTTHHTHTTTTTATLILPTKYITNTRTLTVTTTRTTVVRSQGHTTTLTQLATHTRTILSAEPATVEAAAAAPIAEPSAATPPPSPITVVTATRTRVVTQTLPGRRLPPLAPGTVTQTVTLTATRTQTQLLPHQRLQSATATAAATSSVRSPPAVVTSAPPVAVDEPQQGIVVVTGVLADDDGPLDEFIINDDRPPRPVPAVVGPAAATASGAEANGDHIFLVMTDAQRPGRISVVDTASLNHNSNINNFAAAQPPPPSSGTGTGPPTRRPAPHPTVEIAARDEDERTNEVVANRVRLGGIFAAAPTAEQPAAGAAGGRPATHVGRPTLAAVPASPTGLVQLVVVESEAGGDATNTVDVDDDDTLVAGGGEPDDGNDDGDIVGDDDDVGRDDDGADGGDVALAEVATGGGQQPLCRPECRASHNERCQRMAVDGGEAPARCVCRPGFARMFPDRPCKREYSWPVRMLLV